MADAEDATCLRCLHLLFAALSILLSVSCLALRARCFDWRGEAALCRFALPSWALLPRPDSLRCTLVRPLFRTDAPSAIRQLRHPPSAIRHPPAAALHSLCPAPNASASLRRPHFRPALASSRVSSRLASHHVSSLLARSLRLIGSTVSIRNASPSSFLLSVCSKRPLASLRVRRGREERRAAMRKLDGEAQRARKAEVHYRESRQEPVRRL
ncbi:hypothetical protein FA09DRAFT_243860 [Tilletiopsis washingtonensis]|jgi:hypothetical protein|uniref:Uncharacterized protein n=1 Tax=Tilletiopsis washingtonensis TaxID=58919 RepID=A0A316ZCW8_9BASI|nr:hypothetical protein FA09DRAFT_243860 [Tilletiopsis washingtonensis]PWN99166.1 hypothetical protein FA09DRAFT_243860 [Tilletiopsis washingtonensis]